MSQRQNGYLEAPGTMPEPRGVYGDEGRRAATNRAPQPHEWKIRRATIRKVNGPIDKTLALLVFALSALGNVGGFDGGLVLWRVPSPPAIAAGLVSLVGLTYVQWRYSPMHNLRGLTGWRRFWRVVSQLTWQWLAAVLAGCVLTWIAYQAIVLPWLLAFVAVWPFIGVAFTHVVGYMVYGYLAFAVEAMPEDALVDED